MSKALEGLGVSAGRAVGPLLRLGAAPQLPAPHPVADVGAQRSVALAALRLLGDELDARAARAGSAQARDVLDAQALIARDTTLADAVADLVGGGQDAAHAVHAAFTAQAEMLRAAGGYLAERAADLEDLRARALAYVLGVAMPGVPDPGYPYVLAADDLSPADTAQLDPASVLALVTARGGPTSHTAILARALGLPAVVGCPAILEVPDGAVVSVDGDAGVVQTDVPQDPDSASPSLAQPPPPTAAPQHWAGPGRTADGHPVPLLLNAGSVRDARSPAAASAEGVGLLRTELLFLSRQQEPSLAEQRAAYAELFAAFLGRRVVVRTLDAGADKPLPFLGLEQEPNPALGVRGLRIATARPDVLDTQLEAIALAAKDTGARVWCMAPMVATAGEAAGFKQMARAHGLAHVGAMVEIPAAALRARHLLEHMDFLSIGTNDLGQYTLAADRQCGALSELLDPWQPALLDLVAACARAGREAGKPVGVCGEAAADPLLACVLVGLGVSSLSMSGAALARVGQRLRRHTRAACEDFARAALEAGDAAEARAVVQCLAARTELDPDPDPNPTSTPTPDPASGPHGACGNPEAFAAA